MPSLVTPARLTARDSNRASRASSAVAMDVRLTTDDARFAALKPAWDRLHRAAAPADPFLSHEWFEAAWQWCRRDADLHVLTCHRDDQIVAVLPLMRPHARSSVATLRFLDSLVVPDTQRFDVLVAATERGAATGALADALCRRGGWDALRMRGLADDAVVLAALAPALRARGARDAPGASSTNPWIALDGEWQRFYASRSRRLKKAVNLASNRLGRAGVIAIDWLAPGAGSADDVARAIDAITAISGASWKSRTGNSLDNEGPAAFIRRLASLAHARGWLSVFVLTLDGRPVAMEFALASEGQVFALRSDFDASLEEVSPGSHLNRQMLETLFAAGLSRYWMGPGDNAYKYRWAEGAEPVHAVTVYARSARGRALALWDTAIKPRVRALRDRLRPPAASAAPADEQEK